MRTPHRKNSRSRRRFPPDSATGAIKMMKMNRRTGAFDANGAAFIDRLGQRPKIREPKYPSAESATHSGVESHFQRFADPRPGNPGVLPQADLNGAPLALKRFGRILSLLACVLLVAVTGGIFAQDEEEEEKS